jgi:hypothetical protein
MPRTVGDSAQRIAEKGREALRARMREAFAEAAAAHSDVLGLDEEKLEEMVSHAVERADGLQWRRALAAAATEELGIGLGEALGHPAVARAQSLVGAPSYEEGLAAIAEGKAPEPGSGVTGADAAQAGVREGKATEVAGARGSEAGGARGGETPTEPESIAVRIAAVHLDGPLELDGESQVTLTFSEDGLEVLRGSAGPRVARYSWSELQRVEVQPGRRSILRRRPVYPRVIVGAAGGEARFEVEGMDAEWLEQRLAPVVAKLAASG